MDIETVKVLLVEDNDGDALILRQALAEEKESLFEIEHVKLLSTALAELAKGGIELILCDLGLPDSDGSKTVSVIRRHAPQVPIVVLTASDDDVIALEAMRRGAEDYLVKGYVQVYPSLLRRAMRYAVERKRAQDEIRVAKEKTEKLLSSIPSILIELDPKGLVSHWNPVAETVFGMPSAHFLNRPLDACNVEWDIVRMMEGLERCRSTGQLVTVDKLAFKRPDGQDGQLGMMLIPMKRAAEGPVGVLIFGADITERMQAAAERKQLQEQLIESQRLETVGRFAGGIAHDFNNFLQIILGFTGLIRARHKSDQTLLNDLGEVIHAAESAAGMIQQLLAFSRRRPSQPKVFELNQHLANMIRLIQQLVGGHIRVNLQLGGGPLIVKLDPTGLEQIIMNLSSNARDSMEEGGTLTISTTHLVIDAAFARKHSWAKPGDYVRASVQDSGTGMDAEMAARIFEPFFTTKKLGRGTGLGLAVVYGLVTQHEGLIDIETSPGQGTTFHLYFSRQKLTREEEAALEVSPSGPAPAQPEAVLRVKRRILIVDDDSAIGTLCSRMLEGAYATMTTDSAHDALEILGRESYDILLSDIRMPEMDGFDLTEEAIKRKPDLKVLMMTGSLTNELEQRMRASAVQCEVIRKPFTAAILQAALDRCW